MTLQWLVPFQSRLGQLAGLRGLVSGDKFLRLKVGPLGLAEDP